MLSDADRELAALAARHHSVFTLDEARQCGLTAHQIDIRTSGAWLRVHEGVYRVAGSIRTWHSDLYAATRAATFPAAISHRSAAALYGLPDGRPDLVEITCRRWNRTRQMGMVVRESTRLAPDDITHIEGIAVVTVERLILELAGLKPYPDSVERVIQAARRKRLIAYESTVATFDRLARRGVKGVKAMRIALERWDPSSRPTQSDMETLLVQVLRAHGLPAPVTQFRVLDEFGNLVATWDAALPHWRVTIEYQSKQEHLDEFQTARDDVRRNEILAAGYFPIAARYEDLRTGGNRLADQILRTARRPAS